MTERDPDAWWSPVPGGHPPSGPPPDELVGPPLEGPPTYAALWTAGDPYGDGPSPLVPPAPPRRRRRRPWLVAGAAVLVVGVVLALVLGPVGTKTLTDPGRTVSVDVPRTWYDNTAQGADPDEPALLAASNLWQSRYVVVDRWSVEPGATLASFHDEGIEHECGSQPCTTRSGPRALVVDGHEALEQVVTHPAGQSGGATTLVVLTLWVDRGAIEVYAGATALGDGAPAPGPLERIASSVRLHGP